MRMLLSTEILAVKVHLFEVRAIEGSVVSCLYPSVRHQIGNRDLEKAFD